MPKSKSNKSTKKSSRKVSKKTSKKLNTKKASITKSYSPPSQQNFFSYADMNVFEILKSLRKYCSFGQGRKTHGRTDRKPAYRKFSTVPLHVSFEGLRQETPRVFRVMLPLIFPGVLITNNEKKCLV